MTNYGRIQGSIEPQAVEITNSSVFLATNIEQYTEEIEGQTVHGYEYNYVEYTKDEYLLQQTNKIAALEEELKAAKILLGVDDE